MKNVVPFTYNSLKKSEVLVRSSGTWSHLYLQILQPFAGNHILVEEINFHENNNGSLSKPTPKFYLYFYSEKNEGSRKCSYFLSKF